eukprot:CAMPEP_0119553306 /NCGR_PEP_ID=MMETSP1352-20130426/6092_1 /TAXON_ID=265584 /ORGANISM="Stauroneis constricta, Strain CCMP1120" /LENGTH=35 /DNA_ID=CAMNT_0007599693 /DNA_START=83 /DNA_END=187 /DNA_ORIENTATION=+
MFVMPSWVVTSTETDASFMPSLGLGHTLGGLTSSS